MKFANVRIALLATFFVLLCLVAYGPQVLQVIAMGLMIILGAMLFGSYAIAAVMDGWEYMERKRGP